VKHSLQEAAIGAALLLPIDLVQPLRGSRVHRWIHVIESRCKARTHYEPAASLMWSWIRTAQYTYVKALDMAEVVDRRFRPRFPMALGWCKHAAYGQRR
jgi:hypothetical protein